MEKRCFSMGKIFVPQDIDDYQRTEIGCQRRVLVGGILRSLPCGFIEHFLRRVPPWPPIHASGEFVDEIGVFNRVKLCRLGKS